jgi:antitoxin ChpS
MSVITIRQSGGAGIISIPSAKLRDLNLHVGSKLRMEIVENKLLLTPIKEEVSLDSLVAGSPRECFVLTDEDREWNQSMSVGKEE